MIFTWIFFSWLLTYFLCLFVLSNFDILLNIDAFSILCKQIIFSCSILNWQKQLEFRDIFSFSFLFILIFMSLVSWRSRLCIIEVGLVKHFPIYVSLTQKRKQLVAFCMNAEFRNQQAQGSKIKRKFQYLMRPVARISQRIDVMWNYFLIKSESEYRNSTPTWTNFNYNSLAKRKQFRKEISKKIRIKYPLYRVVLWRHSYVERVLPESVFQNIVKFFLRNSHNFVEWTQAIQSEYETLMNHSASETKNSIWVKNNLQLFEFVLV